jgi:hypothetical protein
MTNKTTTTTTEAPALITRLREGDEQHLNPLRDALNAVLLANRGLRKHADRVIESTNALLEEATTGHCFPQTSIGVRMFHDPTEDASIMASAAAAQREAMKAVYMVADALGFETDLQKSTAIEDAIRYLCENSADWRCYV